VNSRFTGLSIESLQVSLEGGISFHCSLMFIKSLLVEVGLLVGDTRLHSLRKVVLLHVRRSLRAVEISYILLHSLWLGGTLGSVAVNTGCWSCYFVRL